MPHNVYIARLAAVAGLLALAACGSFDSEVVTRTVVEICPTVPPILECPEWPENHLQTLADLWRGYEEGRTAHARCEAAVGAWDAIYAACAEFED